jgi:hypothetical protein
MSNQEVEYLETEPDKIKFFCEHLGISKDSFPAKIYEGGPGSRSLISSRGILSIGWGSKLSCEAGFERFDKVWIIS